jgi:hypothetical protein
MSEMTPATAEQAQESYRKEARFHAVCQSIVAEEMKRARRALEEVETSEPWRASQICDRIATAVAARVLQTVYQNDGEIAYWKSLGERISSSAMEMALASPMPILVTDIGSLKNKD